MPLRPPHGQPHAQARALHRAQDPRPQGYDRDWDRLRAWFLRQPAHVCCAHCAREGRVVLAREVDHIVPFTSRTDAKRLDPANLQGLCVRHHRQKHRKP